MWTKYIVMNPSVQQEKEDRDSRIIWYFQIYLTAVIFGTWVQIHPILQINKKCYIKLKKEMKESRWFVLPKAGNTSLYLIVEKSTWNIIRSTNMLLFPFIYKNHPWFNGEVSFSKVLT